MCTFDCLWSNGTGGRRGKRHGHGCQLVPVHSDKAAGVGGQTGADVGVQTERNEIYALERHRTDWMAVRGLLPEA